MKFMMHITEDINKTKDTIFNILLIFLVGGKFGLFKFSWLSQAKLNINMIKHDDGKNIKYLK